MLSTTMSLELAKKETPEKIKNKVNLECSWEPATTHNSQSHECAVNLNSSFHFSSSVFMCLLREETAKSTKKH